MPMKLRITNPFFPMHITARSNNREQFPVPLSLVWELLADYLQILKHEFGIEVLSFVLMPNHFHLICKDPKTNISKGMQFFMRESSKELGRLSGRINKVWGGPFFSSVIANPLYFFHAYKYVYRNPVRANLCDRVELYPYSSLAVLLGNSRTVLPMCDDTILFEEGLQSTLDWLNTDFSEVENKSLRNSLRRSTFKLRKDPATNKELALEDWSSLPIWKSKSVPFTG